ALQLETIEPRPVTRGGRIVDIAVVHKNLARDLIEDFMIAANVATSRFLEAHGTSGIRRVVREPERWNRIVDLARLRGAHLPEQPDSRALAEFLIAERARDELRFPDLSLTVVKLLGRGEYALDVPGKDPGIHFGLAAHDYSHATAPNRRYADLIQQRQVKAVLSST
ncbi:MAG: ribonuclease catalytic domain-containing protein, partial [Gemmatimonadaceae bacterium]